VRGISARLNCESFPPLSTGDIIKSLAQPTKVVRRVLAADGSQTFQTFVQQPVTTELVATKLVEHFGDQLIQIDTALGLVLTHREKLDGSSHSFLSFFSLSF
jgi:hypothetical protein